MADDIRSSQSGGTTLQAPRPKTPEPAYDRPVKTGNNNRKLALGGILGLAAVAGIITGFAATNNSPPASRLLGSFSGVGTHASAPFRVPSGPVTARYSYACPAGSGSHGFASALINTSRREIVPIARTSGTSGASSVTLHPAHPGGGYQIGTTSPCPYRVSVYAP
jgi:hypothetical protein